MKETGNGDVMVVWRDTVTEGTRSQQWNSLP